MKQDILPEDLMDKLTEIIVYQMRNKNSETLWKRIKMLRRKQQMKRISQLIHRR